MQHVAIDLASVESQICIRAPDGTICHEERLRTSQLPEWLKTRSPSVVVMEACSEAFVVADAAAQAKHEVRVVPGSLVRALGVGARGIKNDVRDARALSETSCRMEVPSVAIASQRSRELKSLCRMRETLVRARTQFINSVRGWMRANLIRVKSGDPATFSQRLRDTGKVLPSFVYRQLMTIEMMSDQIKDADQEVRSVAMASPICRRLMSIPGVGPTTAVLFESVVDNPDRFSSGHALESYLGLTPGERSSGDKKRTTGITKAGPTMLRSLLVQCAWSFVRTRKDDPACVWAVRVMERRGRQVGIVALARKLAGIMFALWRKNEVYVPAKSAAQHRPRILLNPEELLSEARS